MTFGEKLKKLRFENSITQDELAKKVFVSRTTVSKWETDSSYPSVEVLKLLATVFGVSIDELFTDDDVKNKKLIEDKVARRFYLICIGCFFVATLLETLGFFLDNTYLMLISVAPIIACMVLAVYAKPRYKRIGLSVRYWLLRGLLFAVILILVLIGLVQNI